MVSTDATDKKKEKQQTKLFYALLTMCALWHCASRTKQVYYDLMMYFVTNAGIFMCFSCSFAQSSIEWCENWDTIIHRVNAMKCDELRSLAHGMCNIGKRSEKNNTQRNGRRVMITAWKVERANEKKGNKKHQLLTHFFLRSIGSTFLSLAYCDWNMRNTLA